MLFTRARLVLPCFFASLLAGYVVGAWSFANDRWPIRALRDFKRASLGEKPLTSRMDAHGRLVEWGGKTEIDCPAQDSRTAVVLFIGQSLQSNSAGQRSDSAHGDHVVNYFNGRCVVAKSPLLGSTSAMGEALTPLGNLLVTRGAFDRVVLVPAAIGGVTVARWADGGDLQKMLAEDLERLRARYRITHVVWHQGEDDFNLGTSRADYEQRLRSVIVFLRAHGVDARIFVSVASRCDDEARWTPDNPVTQAQRAIPDPALGVYPGVDTDALLAPIDRYDECHLGASGVEKYARALADVLAAPR